MSEALKVKLKFDNAGIGHNRAKEFTNHWWDHAFNKAAKNITVTTSEVCNFLFEIIYFYSIISRLRES